jgi:tetratricopeptide (TPR) repeat protein/DNA-binding beta-propeller fold protein YncE
MDIRGNIYLVDGFQNVAAALPRLYKIDGRTGQLLWTTWGVIDKATGKPRPVDGTPFDGRKIGLTGHAHLWDTDPTVWVGSSRTDDEISQVDIRNGTLLKRVKVPLNPGFAGQKNGSGGPFKTAEPGTVRVAPDGTLVTASITVTEPLMRVTPAGEVLWQLQNHDANNDGDRLDPPDPHTGWGELMISFVTDVGPLGIDIEGCVYGTAPASASNRTRNGLVKYDARGQILLWADFCPLGPDLCEVEVSADGKQIAANYKHSMQPMVNQADFALAKVQVKHSPAQPSEKTETADGPSDMSQRLGDGVAGELNRGRLALARKEYADAVRHLSRAADGDDPDISAVAYFLWATACRRQGEMTQAVSVYSRCAARWSQEKPRALLQAAECLVDVGRSEDAVGALAEAERADQSGFWGGKAVVQRAALLRRLGKSEASVALARDAGPRYPLVLPNLLMEEAESLLLLGRDKDAVDRLLIIVRRYPLWSVEFHAHGSRRSMRLLGEAMKAAGIDQEKQEEVTGPICGNGPTPEKGTGPICAQHPPGRSGTLDLSPSSGPPYVPQPGKPGDYWPDVAIGQETIEDGWYMHSAGGSAKGKGIRYNLYPRTIPWPIGLYSDGRRLIVAGYNAGRLCYYDPIPTENFAPTSLRVGGRIGWDYMTLPGGMAPPGGVMRHGLHRCYLTAVREKQKKEGQIADMTMNPVAVCSDGKSLYVTDSIGNRLLVFNRIPDRPDAVADFAIGQPNLWDCVPNFGGLSASSVKYPYGAHCDGKYLWVADRGNHRVLRWTLPIKEHFQRADLVLGQADLASAVRNSGGLSAASLNRPGWVHSDGRCLVVADTGNHRVLLWKELPAANRQPANVVLGQKDFQTALGWNLLADGYIGMDSFAHPTGVLLDDGKLYVCDSSNNRVLVWNAFPSRHGQPADAVIGQPDLDHRWTPIPLNIWYYGYLPNFQYKTAGNLYFPIAIAADAKNLYVSDYNRCRVLIYRK